MHNERERAKFALIILIVVGGLCLLQLWLNSGKSRTFLDFLNSSW